MARRNVFPVQLSILKAQDLGNEVAHRYGLSGPTTCELFAQGVNDTYVVSVGHERYALRVYRSAWRTDADVAFELDLLEHLKQVGANICAPLRTLSRELSFTLNAPEGRRRVGLFEFAVGSPPRWDKHDPEEARGYGVGVGLIHAGMDSFRSRHPRFHLDFDHLLTTPLQELESRISHRSDDWAYLQRLAHRLHDSIGEHGEKLTRGICHGDFHGGNANRGRDGSFQFFDFDCAGPGWRAYDLAVFRWALMRRPKDYPVEALWQAFVEGYSSRNSLKDVDLAAVPEFVAIRQIWLMGLHATIVKTRGSGFMNDAYFDREMKILRDWQASELHE